jgi:hypothetical protein
MVSPGPAAGIGSEAGPRAQARRVAAASAGTRPEDKRPSGINARNSWRFPRVRAFRSNLF